MSEATLNRLTVCRLARIERGLTILDLTNSNPTLAGIAYPVEEIAAALARGASRPYEPDPRGLLEAREALAADLSWNGAEVSPDDLILTASTSEAYSYLFKLLCNPGDEVITGVPTYPLLDHLARLDAVVLRTFPFDHQKRWSVDPREIERTMEKRTRAIAVVHPNNPTGTFLTIEEQDGLAVLCEKRAIALISDEVFFQYPLDPPANAAPPAARRSAGMAISLGGLSKSAGLPHLKLAWIQAGGGALERKRLADGLEMVADQYLSVSAPVQRALPELLRLAPRIREAIHHRVKANMAMLREMLAPVETLELLPAEGGWAAVIRFPAVISDEAMSIELLTETGVLVQPGYFFDFPSDGYLIVSLLCAPDQFEDAVARMRDHLAR